MTEDLPRLALGPGGVSGGSLVIQVLLILAIAGIAVWLLRKRGAKQLAVRRLLIIAFALFAAAAVMMPSLMTSLAQLVGVGRGADLLLYATVVVLLGVIAMQEARAKNEEKRTTHLARRLALGESVSPLEHRRRALATPAADTAHAKAPAVVRERG